MKINFYSYKVSPNHSFLFLTDSDYDKFNTDYRVDSQEYDNIYISEGTTSINYRTSKTGLYPQHIGYIIVEDGNKLLNFIVTGWERLSNEVIKFSVTADIFRNDLNYAKDDFSNLVTGYVDQTNGAIGSVDAYQRILPTLGEPVKIENETFPLKNDNGTNWCIIVCAETTFGDYGVFATGYTSDIGTMTRYARVLTTGTTITLASNNDKSSAFKPTACYIVPKPIIRSGYEIAELAYQVDTLTHVYVYPINAFFERFEVSKPATMPLKIYDFGTIAKRVTLNKQFDSPIYIISSFNSSDISIGIQYNNIYIDVTDEFAYPITTDEFSQYASLNKRDFAIKSTTTVGGIVVGAGLAVNGIATGNLVQAGAGAASIISGISKMAAFEDKNEQPYSITGNNDGCANITFNNGFSFRTYGGRNYEEAYRTITVFGYQYQNVKRNLNTLINFPARILGKTFIRFKTLTNPENVRSETLTRLLNGVFV